LVVYLNPSAGTDPGHMVVGGGAADGPTAYFGDRFNPVDLPEAFRSSSHWRNYRCRE
jgi:hypothetical protein